MMKHIKALLLSTLLVLSIAGCSSPDAQSEPAPQASSSTPGQSSDTVVGNTDEEAPPSIADVSNGGEAESSSSDAEVSSEESSDPNENSAAASADAVAAEPTDESGAAGELAVHFGDDGAAFTMHLYDNSTATAIASYVGTADWRLPIYNYEGYDNWEVMQYYDLPSRYEIPSNAETVTAPKAGEVYYSEPNRMVLFYGDAEVTGEYTSVGYFDATAEFVSAVQDNPVLEGWGNKIVLIKD